MWGLNEKLLTKLGLILSFSVNFWKYCTSITINYQELESAIVEPNLEVVQSLTKVG